jgi:hypothetical protein
MSYLLLWGCFALVGKPMPAECDASVACPCSCASSHHSGTPFVHSSQCWCLALAIHSLHKLIIMQVLTVYVAHDIQSQDQDPSVINFLASDPLVAEKGLDASACRKALTEIGFTDARLESAISTLSGVDCSTCGACNDCFSILQQLPGWCAGTP